MATAGIASSIKRFTEVLTVVKSKIYAIKGFVIKIVLKYAVLILATKQKLQQLLQNVSFFQRKFRQKYYMKSCVVKLSDA